VSNYHRTCVPGGSYFFTVVTHNRAPIFAKEAHVEVLRQAFRKVMAARPFEIDAMVVLPEHLHCIWRMPEGDADYPKFLCYPNPEARQSEVKQRGEGDFGLAAMILSTM